MAFDNDPNDRKRRFLRGLNCIIGLEYTDLEKNIPIKKVLNVSLPELRTRLANFYGLEFTPSKLKELLDYTTQDFTEEYCPIIYEQRGDTDLNTLVDSSIKDSAIDLSEMEKALKFGLNGSEWCDVAKGPCACGAWHK